jgi:hypothetical protein
MKETPRPAVGLATKARAKATLHRQRRLLAAARIRA